MVQANLLAACATNEESINQVYNIAVGGRTTLNELYSLIRQNLVSAHPNLKDKQAIYRDFREGDVLHSLASIDKAKKRLSYLPTQELGQGLELAMPWYTANIH